jgi:hypothetical protein
MRPVSAAFLAAVGESHSMKVRARVLTTSGQNGVNPTGTEIRVEDGSVTFDSTAQVQATLDLTTPQAWPVNASDLLTPYGNEIFIERGVIYAGGATEWVSLGYYRINEVDQQQAPVGLIQLSCTDRMQGIVDARIVAPITFTAGTAVSSIIQSLVTGVYSWATYSIDSSLTTASINVDQITTDDRYGFVNDLVTSYGMVWYWDYRGVLVVEFPPDPTMPVTTLKTGSNGVLVALSRTLSRDSVFNACVASGQQASDTVPPTQLVVDNNPASPTYWYGKFGQVPQFYSSSFLTTDDQCNAAAESILLKSTGLPYEVDFGIVPNPSLELLDPVTVSYGYSLEIHILKQIVVGLKPSDAMTAQTRQLVNGAFNVVG